MKWEMDGWGIQSSHRSSGRWALLLPAPFSLVSLCPHAPWLGVSRFLLNRWKNTSLPGGKKQESKRASRLVPDRFDSRAHSLETSSSLLWPEPWYMSTAGSRESWKRGLCLFSSCDCREGKSKEACERDMVHEGHRTLISLLFLLCVFFICHDASIRDLLKRAKNKSKERKNVHHLTTVTADVFGSVCIF